MGVIDNAGRFLTPDDYRDAAAEASEQKSKFSPGVPINPADGFSRTPRNHDFLTGYNIAARPRRNERVAFSTLQGIIEAYDVAQMAITHRIDSVRSLDWYLEPNEGIVGDLTPAVAYVKQILSKPDHVLPFRAWVSKFLWDVLAYDAGTLYRIRNNAGRAVGLQVIDGTTIAPLLDYHGNRPLAPAPAFVQYAQGVPWNWLTNQDLIYVPFRPLPNSPYGKSPLESILLNANTDLRFQNYFLQRFTEGTMPEGFATAPEAWTPDQIEDFQEAWDALMLGDDTKKHQIRWTPAGTTFTFPKESPFQADFSLFLMRKTAAAYHVTPADLGFTDEVNRASGETQADVQFRIGDLPLIQHVQDILTDFIQNDLGMPLQFRFNTGREVEDRLATAQAHKIYIDAGVISPSEVRQDVFGWQEPEGVAIPRFLMTGSGPIPLNALVDVAGATDPESGAPLGSTETFAPAQSLTASLTAKSAQVIEWGTTTAVQPIAINATFDMLKDATAGITSTTGITGYDLIGANSHGVGDDEETYREEEETAEELTKAELAQFRRFVKARRKSGSWRDFQFSAIDADLAKQLNAEAEAQIATDPSATETTSGSPVSLVEATEEGADSFLAKGWRDSRNKVPQHEYDIALVDHYKPQIMKALAHYASKLNVDKAIESLIGSVAKASERVTAKRALSAQARYVLAEDLGDEDNEELTRTVRNIHAEAWLAGAAGAVIQLGANAGAAPGSAGELVMSIDWTNWTPGNPEAAIKVADGAMAQTLEQSGIVVQGISDSALNRAGDLIATGLMNGDSSDAIARTIREDIGSSHRAEMIAQTEVNRAVTAATLDTYTANGVTQWELVISDDACDECQDVADNGPYDIDTQEDAPPIHPLCRCAASPIAESVNEANVQAPDFSEEE